MDAAEVDLLRRHVISNPPRWATPGAVAVARAADRRVAVFAHAEARASLASFRAFDLDAAWRAAKGAARAALRVGATDEATLRSSSAWPSVEHDFIAADVVLARILRVDAAPDGLVATSTGPDGESAVAVEVHAPHPSPRITYFADWLALRANLGGVDFLRRAEVPADGRRPVVLEDLWGGAFGMTAGAYERHLAEEFAGFRVVRLVRVTVTP